MIPLVLLKVPSVSSKYPQPSEQKGSSVLKHDASDYVFIGLFESGQSFDTKVDQLAALGGALGIVVMEAYVCIFFLVAL